MANELKVVGPAAALTVYFVVNNSTSQVWNQLTSAFENYATANLATTKYCIAATNQGTASLRYVATFPSSIPAGVYSVDAYLQAGASPAEGDQCLGSAFNYQWSGSAEQALYNAPVNAAQINGVSTSSVTTVSAYIGTTVNPLFDSNSGIKADVIDWLGTAVTAATAGVPDVNAKNINNVSTSSVTTINANVGTTSAITFDGNGYQKVDLVDIAGSAVSTSTAQLGVNVVNIAGTASQGAAGYVGIDWSKVGNPTATVGLTNTTISTSQQVASVSGAVASVTGNVVGSVGSISGVTFPTHFASLAIDASGFVTYNNAAPPSASAVATAVAGEFLFDASGYVKANAEVVGDKTGYALSSAGLDAIVVESGLNPRQALSVIASAVAGVLSGAAGPTVTILGAGVATQRIQATVDGAGNRTALTLSPPT